MSGVRPKAIGIKLMSSGFEGANGYNTGVSVIKNGNC